MRKKLQKVALVSVLTIVGVFLIPGFDAVCIILFAALALDMFNFIAQDDENKIIFECLNCNRELAITEIPQDGFDIQCKKCGYINSFVRFATKEDKEEQLTPLQCE